MLQEVFGRPLPTVSIGVIAHFYTGCIWSRIEVPRGLSNRGSVAEQ
jgi:hypothetical protein